MPIHRYLDGNWLGKYEDGGVFAPMIKEVLIQQEQRHCQQKAGNSDDAILGRFGKTVPDRFGYFYGLWVNGGGCVIVVSHDEFLFKFYSYSTRFRLLRQQGGIVL
jgi:hypothetical protein